MEKYFGKEGFITEIANFNYRKEQLEMATFINSCLEKRGCAIVEAGTGVGKSIAYLIPTIIFSIKQNKRVAISTETKALQQQLITSDIPIAKQILSKDNIKFTHSVCFGSNNYVCKKRFHQVIKSGTFSPKDISNLENINKLLHSNTIFTKFDLQIPDRIWSTICRIPELCKHHKCDYFSSCIFQHDKKRWDESNILIINHHLFFSNIAVEKTYLPEFDIIIFDEAQSIEDICSELLGFSIKEDDLPILLNEIYQIITHKKIKKNISQFIRKIEKYSNELKKLNEMFFKNVKALCENNDFVIINENKINANSQFLDDINSYVLFLKELSSVIENDEICEEIEYYKSKLIKFLQNISNFINLEDQNFVYWIEQKTNDLYKTAEIHGQPIEIASIIKEKVLFYYESTFFISATLSINNSFNFICKRYGIDDHASKIIQSPYNYKKQAILYIPHTEVEPNDPDYINFLSKQIANIASITNGNCLVLFTAYSTLNNVYEKLLQLTHLSIHIQGDLSATSALNNYISDNNSILLGVNSFWQGIDLRGDLVRSVIITKLPFAVPDKPITIAKKTKYELNGHNYFYEYYVPEAIIKFKQGFGRLIRSEKDFGIISLLDSRILKKNYGKLFLNSIPECTIVRSLNELKKIYEERKKFFNSNID